MLLWIYWGIDRLVAEEDSGLSRRGCCEATMTSWTRASRLVACDGDVWMLVSEVVHGLSYHSGFAIPSLAWSVERQVARLIQDGWELSNYRFPYRNGYGS